MRLVLTAALLLPCLFLSACHSHPTCERCPVTQPKTKVLRHVVAFKFKDTTTDAEAQAIVDAFAKLEHQIDSIIAFEHGENISNEGFDQGFTHVFTVTFADQAGLDAYLPHPAHKAFVEQLLPVLEAPFVVDYWAE